MDAIIQHGPTILIFVVVLAVLVLVHELGHFLTARFFGIEVEEFGFGFPPRVFGVKKNGTVYSLNWIPLGGFVRIKGEDDPTATGPGSFQEKGRGVRTAVIAAGVAMNLLLSSLLFAGAFMIGLPQISDDLPAGAKVRERRVQVIEVLPEFPASEAGIRAGDVIASIDGRTFERVEEIQQYVNERGDAAILVEVRRGKEAFVREMLPRASDETGKRIMGVALVETAVVSFPAHQALVRGFAATGYYVKEIFAAVGELVRGVFVKEAEPVEFSGPVGIAVITGQVARLGFVYLLNFAALLSVNLAVINILPIPALDGGRLLFILIERVRGRAVRPLIEAAIHRAAFIFLLLLVIFITLKDIERYREQIVNVLKSLFGVT
jgi:regulator of sigma E protease